MRDDKTTEQQPVAWMGDAPEPYGIMVTLDADKAARWTKYGFAVTPLYPTPSVATPDARRVVDLTSAFLPDAKWAAWLLLHAGQQGVNEHRQMMAHSVTLTGRIEELERALAATTPDAQGGGA